MYWNHKSNTPDKKKPNKNPRVLVLVPKHNNPPCKNTSTCTWMTTLVRHRKGRCDWLPSCMKREVHNCIYDSCWTLRILDADGWWWCVWRLVWVCVHVYIETDIQGEGFCTKLASWMSLHYRYQKSVLLNYGHDYESPYAFVHPSRPSLFSASGGSDDNKTPLPLLFSQYFLFPFSSTAILQVFCSSALQIRIKNITS